MATQTPVLVQTVGAATTVATPANVTATYAATAVGTFLIAVIAVAGTGSAPTIGSPGAAWTSVANLTNTAIAIRIFAQANNAGGITAVTSALTNDNSAAMVMYEFQGMPTSVIVDPVTASANTSLSTSATNRTITDAPTTGNGLWLYVQAFDSTKVLTNNNLPSAGLGVPVAQTVQTSTTGATNISLACYFALPGPFFPTGGVMSCSPTINSASYIGCSLVDFLSLASSGMSNMEGGPTGGMAWTGSGAGQAVGV